MSEKKTKEPIQKAVVDTALTDLDGPVPAEAVVEATEESLPKPEPKPSTQDTVNAILSEIKKRDEIIAQKDEQILSLMRDRVELAQRLCNAESQLSQAITMSGTLAQDACNSLDAEYRRLRDRLHPDTEARPRRMQDARN